MMNFWLRGSVTAIVFSKCLLEISFSSNEAWGEGSFAYRRIFHEKPAWLVTHQDAVLARRMAGIGTSP